MDTSMNDISPTRRGWSPQDIRKEEVSVDLGAPQLAAITELIANIKANGLAPEEIERTHFSHPALDSFLAAAFRRLREGPGILVIRGFPIKSMTEDDLQIAYLGVGCHLGRPVSQSSRGDLIGHVMNRGSGRGYQSTRILPLHTDAPEFIALLCVERAMTGGENVFASALRVREIVQQEHPEYMPILERGFPWHRRGEEAPDAEPITPYNVPIYSTVDGVISCRYARETIMAALLDLGRTMTPLEEAALDFFESVALRDDVRRDLQLESGEAVFTNNFEIMHGRNEFKDWPDPARRRLLYRLWMQGEPARPLRREVLVFQNKDGRHGIDPQEGREPGRVGYDVLQSAVNH